MFSQNTRLALRELNIVMGAPYAVEDERNKAAIAAIAKVNTSIEQNPDDLQEARDAVQETALGFDPSCIDSMPRSDWTEGMSDRQISNVMHGRGPDDDGEFTASSMGAAQDELQAAQATTMSEGLRRILASVEGESYKVDITTDNVYVVTYNAKIAVGAFLDLKFAGQVAALLNKTGQNPDGTNA